MNEVLLWVQQLNGLPLLHQLHNQATSWLTSSHLSSMQASAVPWDLLFICCYFLLLLKPTAARFKVCAAVLACMIVGYLPESWLTSVQLYASYSIIYLITARHLTNKRIKYSCVIMALFGFIMASDRIINAGTETWTYQNYEAITCTIHALIICSFVKWGDVTIPKRVGNIVSFLRRLLSGSRCMAAMCYYLAIGKTAFSY